MMEIVSCITRSILFVVIVIFGIGAVVLNWERYKEEGKEDD